VDGADGALAVGRFLLGGLLVVAGVAKLRAGQARFFGRIYAYELVPRRAAWVLARALPVGEIAAGVLLVLGLLTAVAAGAAAGMLVAFTIAIAISLIRGQHQPCGCGGDLTPVQWRLVGRNSLLVVIALALVRWGPGGMSADRSLGVGSPGESALLGLLATVAVVYVLAHDRRSALARSSATFESALEGVSRV
jgi:uncharacterized membrane protein YphA (DoxX/SURF4 family)